MAAACLDLPVRPDLLALLEREAATATLADLDALAARRQAALNTTFLHAIHAHQDLRDHLEPQDPREEMDRLDSPDALETQAATEAPDKLETREHPDLLARLDLLEIVVQTLAARLEPQDPQELPVTLDQPAQPVNQDLPAEVAKDPLEDLVHKVAPAKLDNPVNPDPLDPLEAPEAAVNRAFAPCIALLMVVFSSTKAANWSKRRSRSRRSKKIQNVEWQRN